MFRDEYGRELETASNPNTDIGKIWEKENRDAYLKQASTSLSALPSHISNITNLKMKPEYIIFKPFYSDEYLNRCSNAYLFDDVINSAIERLGYFTLGTSDEHRAILYPESLRPLKSELEAKNALMKIQVVKDSIDIGGAVIQNQLSEQEIEQFETFIHYTDKNAKLGRFLRKNYRAAHVFARSASYIEYTDTPIPSLNLPAGTPIGLKPLKPMMLGNVAIDPDTWEIEAVEYKDPKVKFKEYQDSTIRSSQPDDPAMRSKYLDADNLLYFVRGNNNMMKDEDDFYFGHSTLQSIIPLSEESRRLKQIVFPQLNQSHWAGSMLWFFPNWPKTQMDALLKTVKPGGHIGVPIPDIRVQEMNLQHDYAGLINLQNEFKKGMLTAFGLPSFLMNFEDVTNRATAETVVIGFNESTIQAERTWITDILDDQWYTKLFNIYFPHDEYIHIKMKMKTEFENITFESFLAKAVAAVTLYEKKMMTITEIRDMLKLPPLKPEDYIELGIKTNLTDPATQAVPGTPNLVETLVQQKTQQQTSPSGGNSTATAPDAFTKAKNDLLSE